MTNTGRYLRTPRESFRNQVLNGIPLGDGHYLRLFAVWIEVPGGTSAQFCPRHLPWERRRISRGDLRAAQACPGPDGVGIGTQSFRAEHDVG